MTQPGTDPKTHVGSARPLLCLSSWLWPSLPLGVQKEKGEGLVRAWLVPKYASSVDSLSHYFPTA